MRGERRRHNNKRSMSQQRRPLYFYLLSILLGIVLSFTFFVAIYAQEGGRDKFIELPPNASEEEIERAVKQMNYYIDKLLSGNLVKEVEESGNEKAIGLLQEIRRRKESIDNNLIAERKFSEAYLALHHLHGSIMDMLRMVKQQEMEKERLLSDIENALIINDTLFQRVERLLKEWSKTGGGDTPELAKAKKLIETAKSVRVMADANREADELGDALSAIRTSSKLLKKAIRLLRKGATGEEKTNRLQE